MSRYKILKEKHLCSSIPELEGLVYFGVFEDTFQKQVYHWFGCNDAIAFNYYYSDAEEVRFAVTKDRRFVEAAEPGFFEFLKEVEWDVFGYCEGLMFKDLISESKTLEHFTVPAGVIGSKSLDLLVNELKVAVDKTICEVLWLDDLRTPWTLEKYSEHVGKTVTKVTWVKSYSEFRNHIVENQMPEFIFFDHDLGDFDKDGTEFTGYTCAKWLMSICMNRRILPPKYYIQSSNPVGRKNISETFESYKKHFDEYIKNG